jgi:hypothetical protein
MTPIDEFKELLPKNHGLSEDEIVTMRDLVDSQADLILDSYLAHKTIEAQNSKKPL